MAEASIAQVLAGSARWAIQHGSMLDVLASMPENSCDSCCTDPPYELNFMSRTWDRSGIAFRPETWAAVHRVLKPGAHLLVFGGTRTMHRIACAVEDAGFECRDYLEYVYGSGFPKSLNVAKAIDAHLGAEPIVVGSRVLTGSAALSTKEKGGTYASGTVSNGRTLEVDVTEPSSVEAREWNGFGTALKPSHEPIYLFRKPIEKGPTVAENVLKWRTGALNIDGCRVRTGESTERPSGTNGGIYGADDRRGMVRGGEDGRWPPNFLLTHDHRCRRVGIRDVKANPTWDTPNRDTEPSSFTGETVSTVRHGSEGVEAVPVYECVPGCPVREMDRQSGAAGGSPPIPGNASSATTYGAFSARSQVSHTDSGTASRFFPQFEWDPELDDLDRFFYAAKASRSERDAGLDHFRALSGGEATGREDGSAGTGNPRAGAGRNGGSRNGHPTVKPIELMRWLCRLSTPRGGVCLDPFTGSGSTAIGALQEGFRFVGSELNDSDEEPFVSIARARITYVMGGLYVPRESLRASEAPRQVNMFERTGT